MNKNNCAIGVFDSGLGGLTAVKELRKLLPLEKFIYFGDTGRVPYGTRSDEIITKYALDDLNFLASFGIKAVVVACGTVSSIAINALKENFDIPIISVVNPASSFACSISKNKRIALLATPASVRNGAYQRKISSVCPDAKFQAVACPLFVPLVENGYITHSSKATYIIAEEYLSKLKDFRPDVIILGCTHYPLIKDIISECSEKILGYKVDIVDSGERAAAALKDYLAQKKLLSREKCGKDEFFVSDETYNFEQTASLFLGESINGVQKIDIGKYTFIR